MRDDRRRNISARPSRFCGAMAIVALALVLAACGSGSGSSTSTPAASATPTAPAATPTPNAKLAGQLEAAALQPADVSADFRVAQNQAKPLEQADVPGLSSRATGYFVILVSPDKNEFVNQLTVVPENHDAAPLLDAFQAGNYLPGLTAGAKDAASTPFTPQNAPAGAKAFSYTGTENASTTPMPITGEALAFVHDGVFVVVVHGRFADSALHIDVAALARTLDERLGAAPLG